MPVWSSRCQCQNNSELVVVRAVDARMIVVQTKRFRQVTDRNPRATSVAIVLMHRCMLQCVHRKP